MADQLSSDLASLRIVRDEERPRGRGAWVALVVILLLGGGAGAVYLGGPALRARVFKTTVTTTEIMVISPAQESVQLTASGYVVPQVLSKVTAKVQGRIAKVLVREGQRVAVGDLLFQLEDVDQRARLQAAQTRVLATRASAGAARSNLAEIRQQADRQRVLSKRGVAARATADDLAARATALASALRATEAQIRVAQAEVETERVNLGHVAIRAPIAGVVLTKPPPVGDLVGPSGQPIVELADFTSLVVEVDVPEGRLHLVRLGAPCEIVLDAYPTQRVPGAVLEISQRVNRAKGTLAVKVRFTGATENVLPDMAARVSLLAKALDERALKEPPKSVVPAAAVVRRGGAAVVFTIDDGKVRMVPVTLGPAIGAGFELRAGPPASARLVRDPPETLADGMAVTEKSE